MLVQAASVAPDIQLDARVTARSGQALEVVTDTANRVVSSRRVPGQPPR